MTDATQPPVTTGRGEPQMVTDARMLAKLTVPSKPAQELVAAWDARTAAMRAVVEAYDAYTSVVARAEAAQRRKALDDATDALRALLP